MAYKAFILPTAEKELDTIVSHLMEFGTNTAKGFLDEYIKQLDLLCTGVVEYSLSRMPELAALGYHTALVNNYLFLYYLDGSKLVVAHFFHQRQNYASLALSE